MLKYLFVFLNLWLSLVILCSAISCQRNSPAEVERPRDPWVIRSVLDGQPRMITLALHKDAYAAYDSENCRLTKLWAGGIHLDGAAYNDIKTVQPTSWGSSYWDNNFHEQSWQVFRNGQEVLSTPKFKGYQLIENRITFHYELILEDLTRLEIAEQPECHFSGQQLSFVQSFRTESVPDELSIHFEGQALNSNGTTELIKRFQKLASPKKALHQASGSSAQYWLDRSGCNTCHHQEESQIGPSYRQIAGRYDNNLENRILLTRRILQGNSGVWGNAAMIAHPHLKEEDVLGMVHHILSLKPQTKQTPDRKPAAELADSKAKNKKIPGFGAKLNGVHPSYDLLPLRPDWFKPRVGGMDFLPDGTLLVSTWDSLGAVYAIKGIESNDTAQIEITRMAAGLSEPLGLKVIDDEIYVLDKNGLNQLIDSNGDGFTDEYRMICNAFGATNDFHEYNYGLEYRDGYFYVNLGLAMRLMSTELQHPDRGTVIKIDRRGNFEKIVNGLRQPNGIGKGLDNELFITENQGQWVPANKFIHIREGDFHGCQYRSGDRLKGLKITLPAVWLPQDEIGNSPGQPVLINDGPYRGQMLHCEVTHGGIKRIFLEKISGAYQGAVFRFSQGFEAGINRMVWGPDGALYLGGVGMNGNWGIPGHQFGLQKIKFNGKNTFEILAVRAQPEGFELEFTEGLEKPLQKEDFFIQQWRYEGTPNYGGPKLDLEELRINKLTMGPDAKSASLILAGLKEEHVIYFLLNDEISSQSGQKLWTGEFWYTLNAIPKLENLGSKQITD